MAVQDPEDGIDQMMNSTYTQIGQQLTQLHRSVAMDLREMARSHKYEQERHERLLEEQQARLQQWEHAHRRELNSGFEHVLNTAVLNNPHVDELSDKALMQAWCISEQLEQHDPSYVRQLQQVQHTLQEEWQQRHKGENLAEIAQREFNSVEITFTDPDDAGFADTVYALEKAGIPVHTHALTGDQAAAFQRAHQASFQVNPRMGEAWDGYSQIQIARCILMSAVVSPDALADHIDFLRDTMLAESAPSDNRAVGDEPSSLNESERNENQPAATPAAEEAAVSSSLADADAAQQAVGGIDWDTPVGLTDPEIVLPNNPFAAFGISKQLAASAHQSGNADVVDALTAHAHVDTHAH